MRFALAFILLLPTVAAADDKAPPPFRIRMPGTVTTQPTDRTLERALQKEQLEFFVRERVQRESNTYFQPYQSNTAKTTPASAAISQVFEDLRVESEVNKALKDSRRR